MRQWINLFEDQSDYDLKARYDDFNRRFFDGRLPGIPIRWGTLKGAGGHVSAKVRKPAGWTPPNPVLVRLGQIDKYHGAEIVPGSVEMVISNLYKRSSDALDAILLHEMIHVDHIFGGWPGEGHGSRFLSDRARLSKASGITVPMTDKVEGLEMSDEVKDRPVKEIGVLLRKSGQNHGYVMMSAKAIRTYKPEAMSGSDSAWVIKTPGWTAQTLAAPVSRAAMPIYKAPWRHLKDEALLKDLLTNGELLAGARPLSEGAIPDLQTFLSGSETTEIEIDRIFGKDFHDIYADAEKYDPHGLEPFGPETPSLRAPGYRFRGIDDGVLLISPDGDVVGGFIGPDVAIDPAHQGNGLGGELVAERYLRFGDFPTWHHDTPGYSPAGVDAFHSAHRLLNDPEFVRQKTEVLAEGRSKLTESMPRSLYHGTLLRNVPSILKHGLEPSVGHHTASAYDEYEDLPDLVFAADKDSLGSCFSSILGAMRAAKIPLTPEGFRNNAAVVVMKHAADDFMHREDGDDDFDRDPYPTVEPGDYFTDDTVMIDHVISGKKLIDLFRRHDVFGHWAEKLDPGGASIKKKRGYPY